MKRAILIVLGLLAGAAQAADFEVCWEPPTSYEDGSPLLEQNLSYYTLYVDDTELVSFNVVVGTWCYIITIQAPGTYVAEMTVTDTAGQTSVRSNQATFTIGPPTPGPVTNLTVRPL